MTKGEILFNLKSDHKRLQGVVGRLTSGQRCQPIFGKWTLKEVLAHIAAWQEVFPEDIERILNNETPSWHGFYGIEKAEDKFNAKTIKESKGNSLGEILENWERAYSGLIKAVNALSEGDFKYQSAGNRWVDGTPMTVESLFTYKYEGAGHEGGHAKQIAEKFGLQLS